jgi:hypothetical protein
VRRFIGALPALSDGPLGVFGVFVPRRFWDLLGVAGG